MTVLQVKHLAITFGGLQAVTDFNLILRAGELVGLIGPNGAGKTTVFNLLTGLYQPDTGEIVFKKRAGASGTNIAGLPPYRITRLGMARTFQNIRLFKKLSVIDNVKIAEHYHIGYRLTDALWRTPRFKREERELNRKAFELLRLFNLSDQAATIAENLPYGGQRRLELLRALATNPQLLLLDEPAAGMNPRETQELMQLIRFVKERFDLTILLIEHDMRLVMGICDRILVLDYGRTIAEGTPAQISNDVGVIRAYLGEEAGCGAPDK